MITRGQVSGTTIVTGASSGIGRATAEQFAADGADVAICSRELENVEPIADAITAGGGDAIAVEADVTDRDDVERLVEETAETFDGVDVLVNNAGASFMAGFDDISPNGWDTIVDVNLTGAKNCTQAAAEYLESGDDSGSVINAASVAGQQGSPYVSHYGAAKAAIINLTKSLAYEWTGKDVRVNCVAPGFVATPGLASQMGIDAEDIDRQLVKRRMGTSEEIAGVISFLASPAASFVVGETITAGGVQNIVESPDL